MFLMAAVLATAASPSPLASDERADERVDSRLTRRSSSVMLSYLLAATAAAKARNFICEKVMGEGEISLSSFKIHIYIVIRINR